MGEHRYGMTCDEIETTLEALEEEAIRWLRGESEREKGRRELLERCARLVEERMTPDCGCNLTGFCEQYGCKTLAGIANEIRALAGKE